GLCRGRAGSSYFSCFSDCGDHAGSLHSFPTRRSSDLTVREPRLNTVSLPVNKGFAGGCNAGIASSQGRYIATLNNDAEADPHRVDRKSTRLNSSHLGISYAVFCLKKTISHVLEHINLI